MKTPHRDFRSLPEAAQAEVRRQAFRNLDDGMRRKKVALLAEVHCKTMDDRIVRREEFEKREYRGKKRGRILNDPELRNPQTPNSSTHPKQPQFSAIVFKYSETNTKHE